MGKGTIISSLGDSKYSVRLELDDTGINGRIVALTSAIADIDAKLATETDETIIAQLRITKASFQKQIEKLNSITEETVSIWSTRYDTTFAGVVPIAEAVIENDFKYVVGIDSSWAHADDGWIRPTIYMSASEAFYNYAMLAGTEKWRPTFREGTITAIDTDNDRCTVNLTAATLAGLNVNQADNLYNVSIDYPPCNSAAFSIGDKALVQFSQDWNAPTVIGFTESPKRCSSPAYLKFIGVDENGDVVDAIWVFDLGRGSVLYSAITQSEYDIFTAGFESINVLDSGPFNLLTAVSNLVIPGGMVDGGGFVTTTSTGDENTMPWYDRGNLRFMEQFRADASGPWVVQISNSYNWWPEVSGSYVWSDDLSWNLTYTSSLGGDVCGQYYIDDMSSPDYPCGPLLGETAVMFCRGASTAGWLWQHTNPDYGNESPCGHIKEFKLNISSVANVVDFGPASEFFCEDTTSTFYHFHEHLEGTYAILGIDRAAGDGVTDWTLDVRFESLDVLRRFSGGPGHFSEYSGYLGGIAGLDAYLRGVSSFMDLSIIPGGSTPDYSLFDTTCVRYDEVRGLNMPVSSLTAPNCALTGTFAADGLSHTVELDALIGTDYRVDYSRDKVAWAFEIGSTTQNEWHTHTYYEKTRFPDSAFAEGFNATFDSVEISALEALLASLPARDYTVSLVETMET